VTGGLLAIGVYFLAVGFTDPQRAAH